MHWIQTGIFAFAYFTLLSPSQVLRTPSTSTLSALQADLSSLKATLNVFSIEDASVTSKIGVIFGCGCDEIFLRKERRVSGLKPLPRA